MTDYIVSAGTAAGITLNSGDTLTVVGNGTVIGTIIHVGGSARVLSGGSADYTIISSGGSEVVSAGGTDSETTVSYDGSQYVLSGGTAIGTTVGGTSSFQFVFSGGTTTGTVLSSNGAQIVNGVATGTILGGSSYQQVNGGGVASGTVVGSSGSERILSGGSADYTIISRGGREVVSGGGTASGTTVSYSGAQYVLSDGTAIGTTVAGISIVSSGGTTTGTIVTSYGTQIVNGVASGTVVSSGGYQQVSSGGVASGTLIASGGSQSMADYGAAVGATVLSGGVQRISYYGTALSATIDIGGSQTISAGGSATSTAVNGGGTLFVLSGGLVTSTTLNSGGAAILSSGATAAGTQVSNGGGQVVLLGATDSSTIVQPGGSSVSTGVVGYRPGSGVTVYGSTMTGGSIGSGATDYILPDGSAAGITISDGGSALVFSGGSTSGTMVSSGGTESVQGGSASRTDVNNSGLQEVSNNGSALGTVVNSGGAQNVDNGGGASGTVVRGGGAQDIYAGGGATGTDVFSGGRQAVYESGSAVGATVATGGVQNVFNDGAALNTTIVGGGEEFVYSGGATNAAVVDSGGVEFVYSGGATSATLVNSGGALIALPGAAQVSATVEAGGVTGGVVLYQPGAGVKAYGLVASGVGVDSGSTEYVLSGGSAIRTTVVYSGLEDVFTDGVASGTIILGGEQNVYSGGIAGDTRVGGGGDKGAGGGYQYVSSGGIASGTIISANAEQVIYGGIARDTTIVGNFFFDGGSQDLESNPFGGVAIGTTITDDGTQYVGSNNIAEYTTVAGSEQYIDFGGVAIETTVTDIGNQFVESGGVTSGTTISGGYQYVDVGGVASGTILSGDQSVNGAAIGTTINDGSQFLSLGGVAEDTTINSGGVQDVYFEGLSSETTIGYGGTEYVYSGGVASGTTINSGGNQYPGDVVNQYVVGVTIQTTINDGDQAVANGGVADDTRVNSDGVQYVSSGGLASATTVTSGGMEYIFSNGTATDTALNSGGAIGVAYLSYTTGGSASVDPTTDILTVSLGGQTYSQQLSGDYTSAVFSLGPVLGPVYQLSGTAITDEGTPCYCRGTLILTDRGERPVEDLHIGDHLITHAGQTRPIKWIGRRSYSGRFAANNRDILPILFKQNALGDNVPHRDLWVSPLHAMFVDDVLVPAFALVNGVSIVQPKTVEQLEYFHLELDTHDIIIAEGVPAETFIDDDSRGMFHNVAEYSLLYPDTPRVPPQYCAPRVEDGEALEIIRRRIIARTEPPLPAAKHTGTLRGFLDWVSHDRIEGWARDDDQPTTPVMLRILDNDVVIGEVVANTYRDDVASAGIGDGHHGFVLTFPGGLSPLVRHVIHVQRASDGRDLHRSPRVLEVAPNLHATTVEPPPAPRRGSLDEATLDLIAGWAFDPARPDEPVALQVLDNGMPIARVLANRYRADLAKAGLGDGRRAFELRIPGGLSPLSRHVIEVRRETDGSAIGDAPVVIEPATRFDPALQQAVATAIASLGAPEEQERVLSFLAAQAEKLLQRHAETDGGRDARLAHQQLRRRFGPAANVPDPGKRALVIDDMVPRADRDAGSQAILSHMRALQRLGYAVSFAAGMAMIQNDAETLEKAGITACRAPFYASVEEVLSRQAGCFDVVYLHRVSNASKYLALVRQYCPKARILYSVADLHHVRLARQAEVENRPELLPRSQQVRLAECTAAWSADAVLTHSSVEAALLRQAVPSARVHVVPWEVPVRPTAVPFAARSGVAFIGGFAHTPNVDAAQFLALEIMPLVWRHDPRIECLLVGSQMPDSVRWLGGRGIRAIGAVADLGEIFDRVRLTVAPLRYGAGVKGKVLASLAAGVPCVMSPVAAEGIAGLPGNCVGKDAAEIAALICRMHESADGEAGLALIQDGYNAARVTAALSAAIMGQRQLAAAS